jgi:hypothetical protein
MLYRLRARLLGDQPVKERSLQPKGGEMRVTAGLPRRVTLPSAEPFKRERDERGVAMKLEGSR